MLQALESRALFSATLTHGELVVLGTTSADRIGVTLQNGVIDVDVNGHVDTFSQINVNQIEIHGSNGADRIDASGSPVPVVIYGGTGNDSLVGGKAGDRLFGLRGNDTLTGGAGNDSLDGGDGNDQLNGSAGNDTLFGSAGDDRLLGGSDCDSLDGGDGNDSLDAGWAASPGPSRPSPETLLGGNGNDTLDGSNNSCGDELDGGAGHDVAYYEVPSNPGLRSDMVYSVETAIQLTI